MNIKQTKGLQRNPIDKYYTIPSTVNICLNLVAEFVPINKAIDTIIEPSAGNGSFICGIKNMADHYLFLDLQPEHPEILKQDYLEFAPHTYIDISKPIHIIGNPPFGRQSSQAIKFIKKSAEFADSISFILPKSFKKDSMQKAFPLNYHLVKEIDLPDNSFSVNNVKHDVPCIFQIWIKKAFDRLSAPQLKPLHFQFVGKEETPDISFRRVGVNAGKIDKNIDEKSEQSHYFIKFTNGKSVDENILVLSTITYEFNNTVGPKSISKQELIAKFNPLL